MQNKFQNFKSIEAKLLLITTILISSLGFFAASAVNQAIPSIQDDLVADISQIQWILNSFTIVLTILILVSGSLSDNIGRKKLLILGSFTFVISSFMCAISPNSQLLIFFRVIQAIGAAFIIPQSLAIISNSFEKSIRGQAIGIWSGMAGTLSILGPILGGFLIDIYNWRLIFMIMVPFGLVAFVFILKFINKDVNLRSNKIDWIGSIIISLSLFFISLFFISTASDRSINLFRIVLITFGILLLFLFYFFERRQKNPIVNFDVVTTYNVLLANIFTVLMYTTISAIGFLMPIYLQQLIKYSASKAATYMIPMSIAITIVSFIAGRVADRYGARITMTFGSIVVFIGSVFLLMLDKNLNYFIEMFPGITLFGIGFGIFIPSLSKTALEVDENFSGMASGFNNSVSRLSGLIAIVILGSLLNFSFYNFLNQKLNSSQILSVEEKSLIINDYENLLEIELPTKFNDEQKIVTRDYIEDSFIYSLRIQIIIIATLSLVCAGISLAIRDKDL